MRFYLGILLVVLTLSMNLQAQEARFPTKPELDETPGELCSQPDNFRYPERIAYCARDVDSYTKNKIIQRYDQAYGYKIRLMKREDFKIDHFIPLCAGGANTEENLWPQHKSIYSKTDPVEPLVCQKMQEGKLRQEEAIRLVKEAKLNLNKIPEVMAKLKSL